MAELPQYVEINCGQCNAQRVQFLVPVLHETGNEVLEILGYSDVKDFFTHLMVVGRQLNCVRRIGAAIGVEAPRAAYMIVKSQPNSPSVAISTSRPNATP